MRSRSGSPNSVDRSLLAVVQVGGYLCSLARTPDDVLRLDPAVFGTPEGLRDVLHQVFSTS